MPKKKKCSSQCGPNLIFYNCINKPDSAITHRDCGGVLIQALGPPNQNSYDKPENYPGKVFCRECRHKVGKAVTTALKTGVNRNRFFFPNRGNYELCSRTYIDEDRVLRFWEWQSQDRSSLVDAGIKELREVNARMLKKKRKIKPFASSTKITREDGDWILTHPRITLRLPKGQFNGGDAVQVERAWRASANIDKTKEELEKIASEVLDIEFTTIINNPDYFGIVEGKTLIVMHRPIWDSETARQFASMIKGLSPQEIADTANNFILEYGASRNAMPGSIIVEADFLDKVFEENPPLEEPEEAVNPCAEVKMGVHERKGPFVGGADMKVIHGKFIISYMRGNGTYWFLTLNSEIWDDGQARDIRNRVRGSTYLTPEEFVTHIARQAQTMGLASNLNSLRVSSTLASADHINF